MPRYFFHVVYSDKRRRPDAEGLDFVNVTAAREAALVSIRELATVAVLSRTTVDGISIEIWDDAETVVNKVSAKENF